MITERIIKNISVFYEKGDITDDELLDICKVCFMYANPKPIAEFGKSVGISRQGVYTSRYKHKIRKILSKQYVLDND